MTATVIPPDVIDVIDRYSSFTIESKMPYYLRCGRFKSRRELFDRAFHSSVNAATRGVARKRAFEERGATVVGVVGDVELLKG